MTTGISLTAVAADGSGKPEGLKDAEHMEPNGVEYPNSFHPDGRKLGFSVYPVSSRGLEMRLLSLDDRKDEPLLETAFNEHSPMFSPDGRWLAYVSDETGREEVYLRPYPSEGKRPISTEGGTEPVWAPNGDELFYRDNNKMMAVTIETDSDLEVGIPELLFEGRFAFTHHPGMARNYDVSRDGQRFLMVQSVQESAPTQINVVLNWVEELKRLVPTGN